MKYEFISENTENSFDLAAEDFVDGILKDAIKLGKDDTKLNFT